MLPEEQDLFTDEDLIVSTGTKRRPRGGKKGVEVVRRQDHFDFHSSMHSEEQTWAVSYADFLMVLLSFFVIFFSVDGEKNKESLVFKIMSQISNKESKDSSSVGAGTGTGRGLPTAQAFTEKEADKLAGFFKGFATVKSGNPTSLTIMLPDNMYGSGQYKMTAEQRTEFQKIVEALKPYHGQVEVVFVGHSDTQKVSQGGGRKYEDNFELSSLRASAAIRDAVNWGFPEEHIKAKASSFNERNTRSISITIQDIP